MPRKERQPDQVAQYLIRSFTLPASMIQKLIELVPNHPDTQIALINNLPK